MQIDSEYAPEKVRNYEMGLKNAFPSINMVLNASVYHYDYSDRQSLLLVPASSPAGIPQYLVQSTDQSADGVDIEWRWKPSTNLTLNVSGAYIDSQFDESARTAAGSLQGLAEGVGKIRPRGFITHRVGVGDVVSNDIQFALELFESAETRIE